MQYLKENRDGSRVHVTDWQWAVDRNNKKSYTQIIAAGTVLIYRMH